MKKSDRGFSGKEIFKKIHASFDDIDDLRAEGLKKIKSMHSIKDAALKKEHKRLTDKYGDDHPKVKEIIARIQYNQGLFGNLDSEIEKAKVRIPSFNFDHGMIHGFVWDKDGRTLRGMTVGVYDKEGNWAKQFGHGCSNVRGYYSIVFTTENTSEDKKFKPIELFLGISDGKGKLLYIDPNPVFVKIGRIYYRDIRLPDEEDVCTLPKSRRKPKK